MGYLVIDLGTTNIKAASFNDALKLQQWASRPVEYIRKKDRVEFNADSYVDVIYELLREITGRDTIDKFLLEQIVLTGQAESLVVLNEKMNPLMNAISWMDERSTRECEYLNSIIDSGEYYKRTGQLVILPTWPATKILWLKKNNPDLFSKAAHYVLLKDYIAYRLTGELVADLSIATFSSYFDIRKKEYWGDMLEACGIQSRQLPDLVEPCTTLGRITGGTAMKTGLPKDVRVNIGTLDHFAGMIGTGNVREGIITLSLGTVMALATIAKPPLADSSKLAVHYGFIKDTYVYLPVAESGGYCLEWYKNNFLKQYSFQEIDTLASGRDYPNEIIFLPYITGSNAPDFDPDASGIFYGLRGRHDAIDLANAVMEGMGHLLAKNIQEITANGLKIDRIIAAGGGAKSDYLCQVLADVANTPIEVPKESEATCLGAAIIGAVDDGLYNNFEDAVEEVIQKNRRFNPNHTITMKKNHQKFNSLYNATLEMERSEE